MKKFIITFAFILASLIGFSQEARLMATSHYYCPEVQCSFYKTARYCNVCEWSGWSHYHYYVYTYPNVTYIAVPTIKVYQSKPTHSYHHHPAPKPAPSFNKPAPKPAPQVHHCPPPKSSNTVRQSTSGQRPTSSSTRSQQARSTVSTRK